MKTILVPYHGSDECEVVVSAAVTVAKKFGSYIEGLFVRALPPIIAGEGVSLPGDYLVQIESEGQQKAEQAERAYNEIMHSLGVSHGGLATAGEGLTAGWIAKEGVEEQVVGEYGRLFDLIVTGRVVRYADFDWRSTCEAALFESGRPVLLVPESLQTSLGRRILVSWNGSTETARALAMSMPLLSLAEQVRVLTVAGAMVSGPDGEAITQHLKRNGVNAESVHVERGEPSPGKQILAEAASFDADLVIKGAYTHSRLREMIFGGATSHLLTEAKIPLLLVH